MPTYSYQCETCGQYYEEYFKIDHYPEEIPCTCGDYAHKIIAYAPCLINTDEWSDTKFVPHFDEQLGQHFESKEERKAFLKKEGIVVTKGPNSPQGHNNSRPRMSRTQAKKFDKGALNHNAVKHGRK